MLRILVSNDDGIEALGIRMLVSALAKLQETEVYVFAPDNERSASGQAITMGGRIRAVDTELEGAAMAVKISGTPADCVKFGIDRLRSEDINPDFVIGGINHGGNAGLDINYSGTFAIANEGALNGCRAIALSVTDRYATHFEYLCDMLPNFIELAGSLPVGTVLNINAPNVPKWQIKGLAYAGADMKGFADNFVTAPSPLTEDNDEDNNIDNWYKYSGEILKYDGNGDSDLYYLSRGYATVTPLRVDRIDHGILAKLRGLCTCKTLCMLIDVQENSVEKMHKGKAFMEHIIKFAKCARELKLPVLLTEQFGHDSSPVSRELKSNLDCFEKLDKVEFDCTKTRDLENLLLTHEGKRIAIAGIETHVSVLQTAKSLVSKGYEVIIIRNCCASRNEEDMEAALHTLSMLGCEIATLESFIYEELGGSTDFAYREISKILSDNEINDDTQI